VQFPQKTLKHLGVNLQLFLYLAVRVPLVEHLQGPSEQRGLTSEQAFPVFVGNGELAGRRLADGKVVRAILAVGPERDFAAKVALHRMEAFPADIGDLVAGHPDQESEQLVRGSEGTVFRRCGEERSPDVLE
jgi:hypothetical protein